VASVLLIREGCCHGSESSIPARNLTSVVVPSFAPSYVGASETAGLLTVVEVECRQAANVKWQRWCPPRMVDC